AAVVTVNSLLDKAVDLTDATVTLRDAVYSAEHDVAVAPGVPAGNGADTITFDPSLFAGGPQVIHLSTIGDTSQDNGDSAFAVGTGVTIQGPAAGLTLSAAPNTMRLFLVNGNGDLPLHRLTP